jgi:hypothetical protein
MKKRTKYILISSITVLFVGLFISATAGDDFSLRTVKPTSTPFVIKRGNYGKYLYGITDLGTASKKVAQYDPTLPADDSVVVPALKELSNTGLGIAVGDDIQPAVETIDESNYVTFTVNKVKVLFELFRNTHGDVGTIRFWKVSI